MGVHADPVQFEVLHLEQITLACILTKAQIQILQIQPGTAVTAQTQQVVGVTSHFAVHIQMRALLSSYAYVSVGIPNWFTLQEAEDTMEFIDDQMFNKGPVPVQFYIDAYLASAQVWQTEIFTHDMILSQAIKARSMWVHYWMVRLAAPGPNLGQLGGKGGGSGWDINQTNRQMKRTIKNAVWKEQQKAGSGNKVWKEKPYKNDWSKGSKGKEKGGGKPYVVPGWNTKGSKGKQKGKGKGKW